jgi:serine/threonine protein kinase
MTTNLLGQSLGQYQLTKLAGEGGIATVYKAYQESLNRWVAVKVLHNTDPNILQRFEREAKAVARLRHRNILMVYEYGVDKERPYIVMEYVEHGTLEDRLTGEPMEWTKVVTLSLAMAEALHYAHQHGLIHRDVKPSNIMMAQEDWPLLTDFGLVKIPEKEDEALTVAGTIMGTPAYIAPEQARGDTIGPHVDMYALGIIMFEMITGRPPFEYENPNMLMLAHIQEPPPSPRELNPACPSELEKIILKAIEKSPEDRFTDLGEMILALSKLFANLTLNMSSSATIKVPPHPTDEVLPLSPTEAAKSHPVLVNPALNARLLLPEKNLTISLSAPGKDELIVGRTHGKNEADIDLNPHGAVEAGISRRHSRLTQRDGVWFLDDLGSMNGTHVNNVKLTPGNTVQLKNGDIIHFGRMYFIFLTSPE